MVKTLTKQYRQVNMVKPLIKQITVNVHEILTKTE